jgi:hypothetical protein
MDQHLGASITLSFGLVVVFAIALYQPDQTPLPRAGPDVPSAEPERSRSTSPTPLPELTPGEALPARPSRAAIGPDAGGARPMVVPDARADPAAAAPSPPSEKVPPRPSVPLLPTLEGFTQALDGETLRDVARRVYGSSEEAESLWRLNRDLLRRKEGTLPAGTLLRTP